MIGDESSMPSMRTEASQSTAPSIPSTILKPLYDANAVAIATLAGAPVAGASLMALNYRRLGHRGQATWTLLVGIAATVLALWLGTLVPRYASIPFSLILILSMRTIAAQLQGKAVASGVSAGARRGSRWKAFSVGITWLCLLILLVFAPMYYYGIRNRVLIGARDEIYFTGTATREDALKLGEALKKGGYFQDLGASVFLDRDRDGATLSLVEQEGIWDQPDMLFSAEEVAREVAPAIGGFPVRVRLVNSNQEVKKQGVVGRTPIGKDEVFYFGTASDSEAQALGKALTLDEYFDNSGATVLFSKDARGTVLSFVVGEGTWEDPQKTAGFESIVREVAPQIGGLPITLRLVNTTLETKKELILP